LYMCYADPAALHSFPTRRSSDLLRGTLSTSNENKMSDGGRDRVPLAMGVWKSSQKWGAQRSSVRSIAWLGLWAAKSRGDQDGGEDRKSTRLNSSHLVISYAVFCL